MVSYTWSKAIDIGSSGWYGVEGHSVQDPVQLQQRPKCFRVRFDSRVDSELGLPASVRSGHEVESQQQGASHIIGNWQVNGIVLFRSGVPYNLSVPGDSANTAKQRVLATRLHGREVTLVNPSPAKWFNTAPSVFRRPSRMETLAGTS